MTKDEVTAMISRELNVRRSLMERRDLEAAILGHVAGAMLADFGPESTVEVLRALASKVRAMQ
jgi:hypothetical protein